MREGFRGPLGLLFLRFSPLLVLACSACSVSPRPSWQVSPGTYVVQRGDTLYDIGMKFGVSHEQLAEVNDLSNPDSLSVGQILHVPRAHVATAPIKRPVTTFVSSNKLEQRQDSRQAGLRQVSLEVVRPFIGKLSTPLDSYTPTSDFGFRGSSFHEGVDMAAPAGTRIHAAHDGAVIYTSDSFGRYGKIVVIKSGSLLTVYAHNSRNRVSVGDSIRRGDWIADVGQSGDATGPHLHFETRVRDSNGNFAAVDPTKFLRQDKTS